MPKSDYIKTKDAEFNAQLQTFKMNIGSYSTLLELTAGQVSAQAADADYFNQAFCCQDIAEKHAQQRTGWKNIIRNGGEVPATGAPVAPTYPSSVPAVAPGVERRFRDLCQIIKNHPAHNDPMSEALGIHGSEQGAPDFSIFKPELTLELSGGQVLARWGWLGKKAFLDMLEIQVDRGQGYTLLTYDTTPNYLDTTPAPATAQKWTYKAIFHVGDQRVGQWSAEVSITVGG